MSFRRRRIPSAAAPESGVEVPMAGNEPSRDQPSLFTDVAKAYAPAILFVLLFLATLRFGERICAPLAQPTWALVVAGILTFPAVFPWIARVLLPRLRTFKVGNVEFELQDG